MKRLRLVAFDDKPDEPGAVICDAIIELEGITSKGMARVVDQLGYAILRSLLPKAPAMFTDESRQTLNPDWLAYEEKYFHHDA